MANYPRRQAGAIPLRFAHDRATLTAGALWIGAYLLFTGRAALLHQFGARIDPYPLEHGLLRFALCGFGFAICRAAYERLSATSIEPAARRFNVCAAFAIAGTAAFMFANIFTYRSNLGLEACARELTNVSLFALLIFSGWSAFCWAADPEVRTSIPERGNEPVVWVRIGQRQDRLAAADILWVQAERECARIFTGERSHLIRGSLRSLEEQLGVGFTRIHRSALVRADAIAAIEGSGATLMVELIDGTSLPVGRAYRSEVRGLLGRKT